MTNREIALRPVVFKRTVGSHVQHILDKPGLASRAQIVGLHRAGQRTP
ncbi:hypothetical protein [Streptomyces sp. NBC_00873]